MKHHCTKTNGHLQKMLPTNINKECAQISLNRYESSDYLIELIKTHYLSKNIINFFYFQRYCVSGIW